MDETTKELIEAAKPLIKLINTMGLYIFISAEDRILKRMVHSDEEVNELFQSALKFDGSLMIDEYQVKAKTGLFKSKLETRYNLYHETPAADGSPYQARQQFSGSGRKDIVISYLHGIINGVRHYKELIDPIIL